MRVFRVLTASERAAAELRSKQRSTILSKSDLDRLVIAKAAIGQRTDKPQGFMRPSKTYASDSDYLRARERNRTETIPRDDRTLPTMPRVYIPRIRGEKHGSRTLQRIREYSGVAHRPGRK